jgi:hypothetical protein
VTHEKCGGQSPKLPRVKDTWWEWGTRELGEAPLTVTFPLAGMETAGPLARPGGLLPAHTERPQCPRTGTSKMALNPHSAASWERAQPSLSHERVFPLKKCFPAELNAWHVP